ncbi:MAG: CaiB/BaiF CoA transferase family protein [Acidimicrobiales bacterium]
MTDSPPPGPLAGVRVIDLTTVVMGPLSTRILADLGADVIKVEAPEGDFVRHFEPKRSEGMSAFSMALNRNKRSIALDLKSEPGRAAMLDLVATADAFVTNVRPKALARLGLTDADLRARRDDLVYCSATGFGSDGPYADRAAYDDVIQASSGLATMFAWTQGEPMFVPSIVADKVAALHIAYAVMAALYRRSQTGEGDHIEVPMAEALAAFNLVEHLSGHAYEPPIGDFSYLRIRTPHRRPRRSADGWVCVLPYSDENWRDFFTLAGRPDLAADERFTTINGRVEHVDALYGELDDIIGSRATAEWLKLCDERSIPAAPVNDLEHLEQDPHFDAVGLFQHHQHPTEGAYRVVKDPVRFASGSPGVYRHPPHLGQDAVDLLTELGYDQDRIDGVVGSDDPAGGVPG